jgi:hypothetical protein
VSRQTSHTIHAPFIFRRIRRTLRLRIERPDGAAPYEAVIKGTFMFGEIPVPGAKLSMMIDRCGRNTSNSPARQRLRKPTSRE